MSSPPMRFTMAYEPPTRASTSKRLPTIWLASGDVNSHSLAISGLSQASKTRSAEASKWRVTCALMWDSVFIGIAL
jgi:hypothetical protein